ncbi:MAG TPA: GNAT family N-acetyltransferase [Candidatus Dormibacteraeota bacterium]
MQAGAEVRPATEGDLGVINEIYNHYVADSHVTFDLEPMDTEGRREWFSHYQESGPYRLFVAVEGDRVIGFASSSPFKSRAGYVTSVETSIYLASDAVGKGVGAQLYEKLFQAIDGEDLHRAYAGIALPNPASVGLHERFGFKRVALFTEPGRKFGRYWDVAWFEKPLDHG